jgi:SAM-dependent methyltransferase
MQAAVRRNLEKTMALGRDVVDAIIREHAYQPITGDVLLIGQQAITLSRDEVLELMREHDVVATPGDLQAAAGDIQNVASVDGGGMSAVAFFALLGIDRLHMLDTGAAGENRYVNEPLPDQLKAGVDFIIDGGALTDLFSPAAVLRNYARALRPGGRLIAVNNLSAHFDPYSIPTASWYLDYCVINAFADCKAYVLDYPPGQPARAFCLDIDCLLDPAREIRAFLSPHETAVILFAEKGAASTTDETPTHAHLRSAAEWQRYRQNLARIKRAPRPHLVRSRVEPGKLDVRGGHLFMRADYTAVDPSSLVLRADDTAFASPSQPPMPAPVAGSPSPSKLKILCVGTGRDGTQSLNHMIQRVFGETGDRLSVHEYCCREIYQAFCDFSETGDGRHADALERMVADCPFDSIVGNGYATVLPLFAEHYGRSLKVVHLYRDRETCIESLITNCELFPTAYRYYSSSPEAEVKRMAAFHFGDMSRDAWDRLPIREKFGWYYDKTHALVRQHLALFDSHIEIATESLSDEATRRAIADFVDGGEAAAPPRTHLNASVIDISSFPKQYQVKMNWLMGRLNMEELAKDDVYALNYFLDKFVAWTGYQITGAPQLGGTTAASAPEIAADLERAGRIMSERLREIDALYKLVRDRGGKDSEQ